MRRSDVAMAINEIERELLEVIREDIGRLVFLASTRDYHACRYYHEVLAFRFSEEMADKALATCHREVFERVALRPLPDIVWEMESYLRSVLLPLTEVLHLWVAHAPYRVLPPSGCEPLVAELFFSNMRMALAILQERHQTALAVMKKYA